MKYEITVSREVAAVGDGTRRRTVTIAKKRRQVVFSAKPVVLAELPPEVANDPHLVVRELAPAKPKKKAADNEPPKANGTAEGDESDGDGGGAEEPKD